MAEFKDVMREWKRMCAYETDKSAKEQRPCGMVCPIGTLNMCGECADWWDEDFASVEERIMKWADEHPAPQYPTWAEWLESQHVITQTPVECGIKILPAWYMFSPIPADIAEKLGIEPKEG